MNKAVFYGRYSSDMQREESIDAQRRACAEYAAAHGLVIVAEYTDEAVSGKGSKTAQRRQYQRMLKDADNGLFNVILAHKFDRVSRSLAEHVLLEKKLNDKGVELIAVAQDFGRTPESKIVKAVMWAMSEYFLDNLAGEIRKGHKENAVRGLHNGGVAPFGYRVENQKYYIDEFEAEYVRRMFDAAQNRTGFKALIQEMDECGIRGRKGKPFRYSSIYDILRNRKYVGEYAYNPTKEKSRADQRDCKNSIIVEGAVPAIISQAQFQEVQKIMESRKHAGRNAGHLCSGLVYCSCGAKMHAIASTNAQGVTYHYFYCSAKCGAPRARMTDVDEAAIQYLQELLSPENQEMIAAALRVYQANEGNRIEVFNDALKKKIREKQKQYDALMNNLKSGTLPGEVVADVGEEMRLLKAEIEALQNTEPPADFTKDTVSAWLESIKAAPDDKAIKLLIERIDIKEKTEFNIKSTLNPVLGNIGAGNPYAILPTLLFYYRFRL